MEGFGKFTYPFCYVPHPRIREAARELIARLDASDELRRHLSDGKMLGTMICRDADGRETTLYAFSGLAGGKALLDGFVPPIFNTENLTPAISSDDSRRIQEELFRSYRVHNALGEELSVREIFALRGLVPPGGTGDCAAPKLLEFAYRNRMLPLAMGEFWYGASPDSEVREQGCFYPSCTGKCGPLLTWMMQGLDVDENPLDKGFQGSAEPRIVFEDESVIVADKPAGMLSVPGRTEAPSLLEWLQDRFGEVHSCHRLDMDTSGLMVFARNLSTKVQLERQFASRAVIKTYRARLTAGRGQGRRDLRKGARGTVALPLALDYYDRPRQMVDFANGKRAITEYEVLDVFPNGEVDVRFTPRTGRTHQLRVHSAHRDGLGRPIKGDRLYGDASEGRLWLYAESLEFINFPGYKFSIQLPDSLPYSSLPLCGQDARSDIPCMEEPPHL